MDDRFFSASEAADALGISLQTLYVYVGRKGIRSQPVPGSKYRRYWRPDIERLRKGNKNLAITMSAVKAESEITLLTEEDLFYRGRSAIKLSANASFESIAALLWNVKEEEIFARRPLQVPALFKPLDSLMSKQLDVDRATALFPMFEAADTRSYDLSPAGMARTGADVLRWLASLTVRAKKPCSEPIHLFLTRQFKRPLAEADLLRRMLVLWADHGFEPGVYAVRAVASVGVTPWRAVMTGLLVLNSRLGRLAGHDATYRFLKEITESGKPENPVIHRLRDGESLPGFDPPVYRQGEPIYRSGDPRARALLQYCDEALADETGYKRLKKALSVVRDAKSIEPSNALVCIYLTQRLGLPSRNLFFSLSRAAGWVAHAIEQHQVGEIQHGKGLYSGPLPI